VASYVVDGLVLPVSVGGHPVLDFCNTRAGWGTPAPKEYLRSYAHLARWAVENGLLAQPSTHPVAGRAVLRRAIALRDALYAVLLRTGTEADWVVINREVRAAAATASLSPIASLSPTASPGPTGAEPAQWRLAQASVGAPLAAVAWSAAGFLTSPAAAGVGACPGVSCGWTFADPRGRRRWCSMAWCGNRAKARRHAERRRGTVGAPD
jgi:predicted RNA-binding Zn ribbon-like protein